MSQSFEAAMDIIGVQDGQRNCVSHVRRRDTSWL